MKKRAILSTGIVAFSAGMIVGAGMPRSSQVVALLLEKLGFDVTDLLLTLWDPEGREQSVLALPAHSQNARGRTTSAPVAVSKTRKLRMRASVVRDLLPPEEVAVSKRPRTRMRKNQDSAKRRTKRALTLA